MKRRRYTFLLLVPALFTLSVVAAIYGTGLSYDFIFTPVTSHGELQDIGGDGWMVSGSTMQFSDLSPRGNRLHLIMKGWRPAPYGKAQYEVSVCDTPATRFEDTGPKSPQKIYLTGDCNPRKVSFHVLNPFRPGGNDMRDLGSQIQQIRVSSIFGVPLVSPLILVQCTLAIFALSLIILVLFRTTEGRWLSAGVPAASLLLLKNAEYLQYQKLFPLWLVCMCVLVGGILVEFLGPRLVLPVTAIQQKTLQHTARRQYLLLFLIFIVAAAFRFYGLNYGLPSHYHPDEVPKVNAMMRMVHSHSLNPNYFLHPSLLLYSTYFMNILFHWFGISGEFRETGFLAGRTVSALAGTFSVVLLFFIARRLFGSIAALTSAALLSVLPLHVACSRYLKEDALLTFFVLASVLALLKAVQEDRRRWLFIAALLAGCSASVKYSGILSAAIICLAPWLRSKSMKPNTDWIKSSALALFCIPLAFVVCSPYTIINLAKFVHDFGAEGHHMLRGHTNPVTAWSQYWMYHVKRSIFPGMGFVPAVVSLMGLGLLLWRRKTEDLFVVFLLLLFYLPAEWVKAKPAPQPERYILPCLPMLAMCAGEFLRLLWASRHRNVGIILAVLVFIFPVWRSSTLAWEMLHDTRARSEEWMKANLPRGSKVYLDWKRYCPEFSKDEFDVTYIPRADILRLLDLNALKKSGKDYLVLSSLFYDRYFTDPDSPPGPRNIFRAIFERLPVVKEFAPAFGTYGFHNPVITVFSLKGSDIAALDSEIERKNRKEVAHTSNEDMSSMYWKKKKYWMFLDLQHLLPGPTE